MWLGAHSSRRRVDVFTGIGTLCAAHVDRYLLVAAQENGGVVASWAASTFGFGEGAAGLDALDAAARGAEPREDTPLFAPWLFGERAPVDDARPRWALAEAERCLPASTPGLGLLGGGARSAVWRRLLADMLQRPLRVVDEPALGGARGAAMTAAVAGGWFAGLAEAAPMARLGGQVEPDPARRSWAEARYGQLRELARSQRKGRKRHA